MLAPLTSKMAATGAGVHAHESIQLLASKLGVGDNKKVQSKAAEFDRLLQSRSLLAGSNVSDTAKVVICLDLAATFYGENFELKSAVKYSGLKLPSYINSRKTVENVLELNMETLSITTLCMSLHCPGVQSVAENILQEFQAQSKIDIDLGLPQYACMAVYQACRLNRVKVTKSKLIEKSRLKSSQWTKMDGEWTKFVEEKFPNTKQKRGRPTKATAVEDDAAVASMEMDTENQAELEPEIEPYDTWRRRILEVAYRELKLQEKSNTPSRRSPRKTPQKFSPYKESPKQAIGVRMLFPMS